MAERILKIHLFGIETEFAHIPDDASVTLEFSDVTDDDPIEWVNVHVRSADTPVLTETRTVDEAADNTPGPMETTREMVPREGSLTLDSSDVTVEELKDILRDKDLPVSGTKQELIDRLNDDANAEE